MSKTLVLLFHPDMSKSTMNAKIVDELKKLPNVTIRDICQVYSKTRGMIYEDAEVQTEQQLLLDHETIVFQFPLFWANIPAACKQYMDAVYTYGFAFNGDGTVAKLHGKRFIAISTTGSPCKNYGPDRMGTSAQIAWPLTATARYVEMQWVGEYFWYSDIDFDIFFAELKKVLL